MTSPAPPSPATPDWTCPFCGLLCDDLALGRDAAGRPALPEGACPRARAGLAALAAGASAPAASVDGRPAALDEALAEAARRLAGWRQPLFGGLGTDVDGARALFRLATAHGAICDAADGDALMHQLRVLQDRGSFTTTLGEMRARADVIVCAGSDPSPRAPRFFHRIGLDRPDGPCRRLVWLAAGAGHRPPGAPEALEVESVGGEPGRLVDVLQRLAALLAGAPAHPEEAALSRLAEGLTAARYAVLAFEPGQLAAHGELAVEMLNRIVTLLNRRTRAAMLPVGGGDGIGSVNQTFTWLSGLPLRTRVAPGVLEHDPRRFASARLVARHAVDGVLWISAFRPDRLPPAGLPAVVLGPPAMAASLQGRADTVFIAVATPGVDAPGHLFRGDGIVLLPLEPARAGPCPPAVGEVLGRIGAAAREAAR